MLPGLRSTGATEIHDARFRSTLIREAHAEGRGASGHHRAVPGLAQGPCAGPAASRDLGRDARDRPRAVGRRAAGARLRHLRPLFRPGDRDRHQPGPARTAQAVDPGARRCRVLRGPRDQAGGQRAAARRGERGVAVRPRPPPGVARQARRRGDPARLCAARHRHPEMEYVAIRENLGREKLRRERRRGRRVVRRRDPRTCDPGIRARRDRARPRDHPEQHQPPGNRADDHRPQFPGEGQRQYRQFDRHLLGRRGGREDGVGDALGRRHGHGSVDRPQHPHDPRMDHPQLAGADRHGADLPGARKRSAARPRS